VVSTLTKRCSASLKTGEMQIKTTALGLLLSKTKKIMSISDDVETLDPSVLLVGM
jgi:hypothetical protein